MITEYGQKIEIIWKVKEIRGLIQKIPEVQGFHSSIQSEKIKLQTLYFPTLSLLQNSNQTKMIQKPINSSQQPITLQYLTASNTSLQQSLQTNTNLRMKYPQDPQKFYQSQQQLNSLLEQLTESLSQQHIPLVIESHLTQSLVRLLNHPNIDIGVLVIELLYELLEEQPSEDQLFEVYYRWVVHLVESSTAEAIVNILTRRLNEENDMDEYEAGLKCIKLVETFMNATDQVYEILGEDKQLMEYLANRIMPNFQVRHKLIDDNKYASSDILINLLSNSQKSQQLFSQFSGIQVLLQTISSYQTTLPTHPDQQQFLSNLFSSLSLLLMNHTLPQNKRIYTELKGNYLMISFLKMKNQYSSVALKCVANSLLGLSKSQEKATVEGLINDGGLKYLLAVLRRKGVRGEDVDEQRVIDENVVAVVYCMVRSVEGVGKDRVEYKLAENRFENLERLFEVRAEYAEAIQVDQVAQQASQKDRQALYLQNLSSGLFLIQTIDKTLLVITQSMPRLKSKLVNLFKIYNLSYQQIQSTLKQHYNYVGLKQQKQFVQKLLATNLVILKKILTKDQQKSNQVKVQEQKQK